MANLSIEEPYALMRARTGLWEPWAGNCPGPPGRTATHCFFYKTYCLDRRFIGRETLQ